MSLPVEEMVIRGLMGKSECILPAACADGCRQGLIRYEW